MPKYSKLFTCHSTRVVMSYYVLSKLRDFEDNEVISREVEKGT